MVMLLNNYHDLFFNTTYQVKSNMNKLNNIIKVLIDIFYFFLFFVVFKIRKYPIIKAAIIINIKILSNCIKNKLIIIKKIDNTINLNPSLIPITIVPVNKYVIK